MALLATQDMGNTNTSALTPAYAAATGGGDSFIPDARTFLHVKNGGGGSVTVTLTTPALVGGLAVQDPVVTVAAGGEKMIGPFPAGLFADSTGVCSIAYSAVSSVTIGVFRANLAPGS